MDFGRIFEKQMLQMLFEPYPEQVPKDSVDSRRTAYEEAAAAVAEPVRLESPSSGRETAPSSVGGPRAPGKEGGPYIKLSDWVQFILLQPQIDPIVVEQRALLTPQSEDARSNPEDRFSAAVGWRGADGSHNMSLTAGTGSTARSRASARGTLRGRASLAALRKVKEAQRADEHVTDTKLRKELAFLKETNGKTAHQKLCDLASRRASLKLDSQQQGARANVPGTGSQSASRAESPGMQKGTFLDLEIAAVHKVQSYYLLRYIHSRELRYSLLHFLNLYRFVQQKVAHGELSAQMLVEPRLAQNVAAAVASPAGSGKAATGAVAMKFDDEFETERARRAAASVVNAEWVDSPPSLPSSSQMQRTSLPCDARDALAVLSGSERLAVVDDKVVVFDGNGVPIMHDAAIKDLVSIENEMIEIGSHYIAKAEEDMPWHDDDENEEGIRVDWVDRAGVLLDLLIAEEGLHKAKWHLLIPYLEIYEHIVDPADRHAVAQRIVDIMAYRPRLDLDAPYFAESYASATAAFEERARLLRTVLDHQILTERHLAKEVSLRMERLQQGLPPDTKKEEDGRGELENPQLHLPSGMSHAGEGFPVQGSVGLATRFVPEGAGEVDVLDFFGSASLAWHLDLLVEDTQKEFVELVTPQVRSHAVVGRACAVVVAAEWQKELRSQPVHHLTTCRASGDLFGAEAMDDPAWLTLLMEDTMKNLPSVFGTEDRKGREKEEEDLQLRSAFVELRSRPPDERVLTMYVNLLEHVTVRRLLADTHLEVRVLESILTEQGRIVGTDVIFRFEPLAEFGEFPTKARHQVKSNTLTFEDTSQRLSESCVLMAGDMDAEFGDLDLSDSRSVVLHCSDSCLREMRAVYQHELANRWLYAMCALHNMVLLDEPMRRIVAGDVSKHGFGTSALPNNRELEVLQGLMSTSALSAHVANEGLSDINETPPGTPSLPSKNDLAKLGFICAFPASFKSMVRLGVSVAFRDSTRDLKQALQTVKGYGARERLLKRFKSRMLSHGSLFITEAACDLAVRVQAARTVLRFQRLVALVPKDFSPFKQSTAKDPRIFVAEDSTIRSIFNIPMPSELLQFRGTGRAPPDVARGILEADSHLPRVFDEHVENATKLPVLDIKYEGPSYVALQFMHELVPLVSMMFFWSSLSGDRRVLLRLHHAVVFAEQTPPAMAQAVKKILHADMLQDVQMEEVERERLPQGPVHKTWDALENMRVDFMNLKAQMASLRGESTEAILSFLSGKVQCAAWRTSLTLQTALYDALGRDASAEATELKRWAQYLEGEPVDGGSHMVSCYALGETVDPRGESAEEAGSAACLGRQIIVRRLKDHGVMGMRSIGVPGYVPEAPLYKGWPEKLHRPCPYLNMFVHALVETHSSTASGNVRANTLSSVLKAEPEKPLPFIGRATWQFPCLPLEATTRGLTLLQETARHAASEVYLQLEMKLEAYLSLREASLEEAACLDAEAELVCTMLTVSRLRETVLCAHLRVPPPSCREDVEALDDYFTANLHVNHSTTDAAEGDDPDNTLNHPAAHPLDDHFDAGGMDDLSGNAADQDVDLVQKMTRLSMKHEMRNMYDLITRLLGELHKVVLKFSLAALSRQQDMLQGLSAHHAHHHGHEHHGAGHAPAAQATASTGINSNADVAKAKAVAAFNRIRLRGTRVRTHGSAHGSEAYVIRENDLEECIEELGRRILQWARVAVEAQLVRGSDRLYDAVSSVQGLEQIVLQKSWVLKTREAEFEAQVQSSIADRGFNQLFEVDRLHRVLNELAAAAFEMEYRLNAEIRHSVMDEIGLLEKQLEEAQNRKGQYFAEMRTTVQSEVQALRQSVLQQLQKMSIHNYALQQKVKTLQEDWRTLDHGAPEKAEKSPRGSTKYETNDARTIGLAEKPPSKRLPVLSESGYQAVRGDIEDIHQEINELRKAETRIQTFFNMKFQKMRQNFEQQIQAFTTTLSSNSDLWERASEIKERQIIAEDELARSQRRAAATHDTIERITLQASKESETAARLESWKANAFEWLDTLQREEKKYQQDGEIDAKKIEHLIERLETEIRQLSRGDQTEQRLAIEWANQRRERKRLRRELREEERLIKKTEAKTNLIRREIECGDFVDDESLVGLLCEEYRSASQKLAELEAENAHMRSSAREFKGRRQQIGASQMHKVEKEGFLEKTREMAALSTGFEEKLCFSIGLTKTPRPPWYHSPIDAMHGGSAPTGSASRPSGSSRSGYPGHSGRKQIEHWSKDSQAMRSGIVQSIRADIAGMADEAKAKAKPHGGLTSRVFPMGADKRRNPALPETLRSARGARSSVSERAPSSKSRPVVRHTVAGGNVERESAMAAVALNPKSPRNRHGSMAATPHSFRGMY